MKKSIAGALLVAVPLLGLGGCRAGEQRPMEDETPATGAGEAEMTRQSMAEAPAPDTTAAALWAYLEQVDYANTWSMWPNKGPLYAGGEPHGMLLTTYLNDLAADGLGQTGGLPTGAIIVKENYMPDSTLAATTVMWKSRGYDAEHSDWFWLKRNADGAFSASGRVEGCIGCHGSRRDNDYVMTGPVSPAM